MDRPVEDRGPDTSMLELKKIVDCLVTNGYEFEGTDEAIFGRFRDENDAIAVFNKEIDYYHPESGHVYDNYIKVSIQFQKRADYKNFTHYGKDENELEGDDEYIGDPDTFIRGLMEEEIQDSTARGTRRKKRKTRKNRQKNSNRRKK
jgi:hypothetical protein